MNPQRSQRSVAPSGYSPQYSTSPFVIPPRIHPQYQYRPVTYSPYGQSQVGYTTKKKSNNSSRHFYRICLSCQNSTDSTTFPFLAYTLNMLGICVTYFCVHINTKL